MGFTEAAGDCRVLMKAAVREAVATESRALGRSDDASVANSDCRFPEHDDDGPAPQLTARAEAPTAAAQGGAPCSPTGAPAIGFTPDVAAPEDGGTSANVARRVANGAAQGGGVDRRLFRHAPGVPTSVSHHGGSGHMDADSSARNAETRIWETSGHGNGRVAVQGRWSQGYDECVECAQTTSPYRGRGLCKRCYDRFAKRRQRGSTISLPDTPPRRSWARDHGACLTCGTTVIPHEAHGLCEGCYGRSDVHKQAVHSWRRSKAGQEKIASIHQRYRCSEKGRLMSLASGKRRQDRLVGIASNLSALDVWLIFSAFASRCANCDATTDICIDHHEPLIDGHAISIANAVLLCRSCNGTKKALPPEQFYAPERLLAIQVAVRSACSVARVLQKERAA